MAGGRCGPLLTALLAAWVAVAAASEEEEAGPEHAALPAEQSMVLPMTASNWTLVMEGEWMLKFAPRAAPDAAPPGGLDQPPASCATTGCSRCACAGLLVQEPSGDVRLTGAGLSQQSAILSAAPRPYSRQQRAALPLYAPWCPSCQQTDSEWETFAKNGELLHISVGKVDVIQEPGLSGRFFVTTLPAFFHAKDGIFRRYRGPGIYEDLQKYILEKKWQSVEPLTGWKYPASLTMSGMAGLFSISGKIWHLHNYFTVTLGMPAWCSYVLFVIATLVFGLLMGLVLVLISECFYLPFPRHVSEHPEQSRKSEEADRAEQLQDAEDEKDDSNEEENKDSLVDDEEEKEDFGDEDEPEEEEEEDNLAAGADEETTDTQARGPRGAPGGKRTQ
ncbi:hypothetical protein QTO34_001900 [Cnephaeus nilssonii]|uniref:Thioredoxin domain-containing protein n=1 Tax=Cnephaeus nilssonii TaxID=3371016 RepID=A0AA40LLC6_CNENI|nr:hypothetical protein QTO34_001900 [Eptesicus nilssonii]